MTEPATRALPSTSGEWNHRVWSLAWPIILANMSVPLAGAVDTAVVGHLPDPSLIGAVGLAAVLFSFLYWAFAFLRMATTGFVAQRYGAKDYAELHDSCVRAVLLGAIIGLALIATQVPIAITFFRLIDGSASVEQHANTYFQYRIWGAPAALINFAVLGILFGMQRMRGALISQLVLNVTNVALDLLFVVSFGWGVEGVAIATVISEYLAMLVGLWFVVTSIRQFNTRTRWSLLLEASRIKQLVVVNLNLMVRTVSVLLVFAHFTAVSATLGDVLLAANVVLMHFFNLASYGLDGFAHAVEALGGYAFGKRDKAAFKAAVRASCVCSVGIAGLFTLVFWLGGEMLVGVMTDITIVRETSSTYLWWLIVIPVIAVWSFLLDGVFVGATRSAAMRDCMLLSGGAYLVAVWLTLPLLGNHGLWLSISVFVVVRGLVLWWQYPKLLEALD